METDAYSSKIENTFSAKSVNILGGIFTVVLIVLSSILYIIIWGELPLKEYFVTTSLKPFLRVMIFVIFLIIGIFIHEVIHGIGFKLFGKVPWSNIKIGVMREYLTPYAHCNVPLKLKQYRRILLLPGIITGILPFIIGLAAEQLLLFIGGVLLISGAYGDFYIAWSLRKVSSKAYIEDHQEKIGCYILMK